MAKTKQAAVIIEEKAVTVEEKSFLDQGALFDYAALDAEARIVLQQRASEIKTLAKRVASDIVEIGGKLAEVKDRLGGNGRFNEWLQAELRWAERTAYNFIAVWQTFGSANFAIENVAPSALYLLVAPSTPQVARDAAIEMANAGDHVTHTVAKAIVEEAKTAEKRARPVLFEEPEEIAEEVEDGAQPTPLGAVTVQVKQEELNEMDACNAAHKIEQCKPIRLYYLDAEPYVITGSMIGDGRIVTGATGWPAKPEKEAEDVTRPEADEDGTESYIGTRVNVGSVKQPEYWVIVGPEYEFELDPSAGKSSEIAKSDTTEKPTLLPQEEINRIVGFCAATKISKDQPIKLCYILEHPYVVAGAQGSGDAKNWSRVDAWPALPIDKIGEANTRSYKDALIKHYGNDQQEPMSYQGIRINGGSAKKPQWWVMVGPEKRFGVAPPVAEAADLPKGWFFDKSLEEGYRAIDKERGLRTLTFPTLKEMIRSAHQIEAGNAPGIPLPTAFTPAPGKPDPQAKEIEAAWRKAEVHISLRFLPADKSGRRVMVTIQAEGLAPVIKSKPEGDVQIIGPVLELIEEYKRGLPAKLAAKKAAKPAVSKPASKPAAKAAKKPAATSKKGAKKK